ncbi:hypothetical protein HDU97_004132 [Phlyctochytrium planicorne]|nr:hypothetical protein HDU97_004132 [Phlyctochytrium planicorne]
MATASSLTLFISLGIRSILGVFVVPISSDLGWPRQTLSLGIAILNLVWGISNPFVCAWADTRRATALVVFLGGISYAVGLSLMALAGQSFVVPAVAILGLGLFMGLATSSTGPSIVLALLGKTYFAVRGSDDRKRLIVFGVVSAMSQLGQFILSPISAQLIKSFGWRTGMWTLAITALLILPLSLFLKEKKAAPSPPVDVEMASVVKEEDGPPNTKDEEDIGSTSQPQEPQESKTSLIPSRSIPEASIAESQNVLIHKESNVKVLTALDDIGTQIVVEEATSENESQEKLPAKKTEALAEAQVVDDGEPRSLAEAIKEAFSTRSFLMISSAFFVCGWHIGFIGTHIPGVATDNLVPASLASWTISFIGATSTIGTAFAGYLPKLFNLKLKSVLSLLYLYRGIMITIFLLILELKIRGNENGDAASALVLTFSFMIGFAWLTTVPLTTALISNIFGTKYLGTLSAITFFGHQFGSFLGAYMGGIEYDLSPTKSMTGSWIASIVLAIFASTMHFLADDNPPIRRSRTVLSGADLTSRST